MARMLYWGAQGIRRNTEAAVDYYRLSAESGDAQAIYDYGIVLLKVSFFVHMFMCSFYPCVSAVQTKHERPLENTPSSLLDRL